MKAFIACIRKSAVDKLGIKWYTRLAEVTRFGLVGLANTALTQGVFSLLFYVVFRGQLAWQSLSYSVGYVAGVGSSFILNKLWTFRDKRLQQTVLQIPAFIIINLLSLGLGNLMLSLFGRIPFTGTLASLSTMPFTMAVNYLGSRFVFKKRHAG